MMTKLTAEERAKRALDYSSPFPGDKVEHWGVPSDLEGMVEPEDMPTTTTINAVGRIAKEIHEAEEAARREAIEKCLAYIETAWFDKDGMLIAVDGKDFLDDVRSVLIEEKE